VGNVILTTTMTVDGVIDVGEWFVAEGEHAPVGRAGLVDQLNFWIHLHPLLPRTARVTRCSIRGRARRPSPWGGRQTSGCGRSYC
jgi:hypothetical protein